MADRRPVFAGVHKPVAACLCSGRSARARSRHYVDVPASVSIQRARFHVSSVVHPVHPPPPGGSVTVGPPHQGLPRAGARTGRLGPLPAVRHSALVRAGDERGPALRRRRGRPRPDGRVTAADRACPQSGNGNGLSAAVGDVSVTVSGEARSSARTRATTARGPGVPTRGRNSDRSRPHSQRANIVPCAVPVVPTSQRQRATETATRGAPRDFAGCLNTIRSAGPYWCPTGGGLHATLTVDDSCPCPFAAGPARAADVGTPGFLDSGGVKLHYVAAGDGPLLVLLHGFPDYHYTWRDQMPPSASTSGSWPSTAGFNKSDKPKGVETIRWRNSLPT